ncbi:hypothetical protein GF354_04775 [Candidatus Peregrinibacteria bacterium]|nr:hypothetical protein [Candidatus Peregrinibacteria bacterium]
MDNFEPYINLALYIINSYFFAIYVVPQLKTIRELKNKLFAFYLPRTTSATDLEQKNKQVLRIRKYNQLILKYKSEYEDIQKLITLSYLGIIIIDIGLFMIFLFSANFSINNLNSTSLIMLATITALIFISIYSYHYYIPHPSKFSDWDYLLNKQGFNQEDLINCANFQLSIGIPDVRSKTSIKNLPKIISISTTFPLIGYKYLVLIFDEKKNLFFKKFSIIDKKAKLRKIDLEDIGVGDHSMHLLSHYAELGEFKFKRRKEYDYKIFLFIFDPCNFDKNFPLYASREFKIGPSIIPTGIISHIDAADINQNIEYKGKGLNFKKIKWIESKRYPSNIKGYEKSLKTIINKLK